MTRRVDEVRTARALKKLAEHRAVHPEAFDPARLPSSPSELAAALGEGKRIGRPPSDDPMQVTPVRLPASMVAALDEARGDRSRGEIVREALEKWLRAERRREAAWRT